MTPSDAAAFVSIVAVLCSLWSYWKEKRHGSWRRRPDRAHARERHPDHPLELHRDDVRRRWPAWPVDPRAGGRAADVLAAPRGRLGSYCWAQLGRRIPPAWDGQPPASWVGSRSGPACSCSPGWWCEHSPTA